MVPLSAVVKIENVVGPYTRTRFNMYPAITINGSAREGISSGKAMEIMEKISEKVLPKDMGYAWSGSFFTRKTIKRTNRTYYWQCLWYLFICSC